MQNTRPEERRLHPKRTQPPLEPKFNVASYLTVLATAIHCADQLVWVRHDIENDGCPRGWRMHISNDWLRALSEGAVTGQGCVAAALGRARAKESMVRMDSVQKGRSQSNGNFPSFLPPSNRRIELNGCRCRSARFCPVLRTGRGFKGGHGPTPW